MAEDIEKKIKDYIHSHLNKGYDPEVIIKSLLKSGFTQAQIDTALEHLKKTKLPKHIIKKTEYAVTKPKRRKFWLYTTLFVLVLLIALVFGVLYVSPAKCMTADCFISKANKCQAATFTNQIEGTTLYYETNKCVLTKTIKEMNPDEQKEVKDAFLGKSMRCKFNKNDFGPLFINSISGHLEACQGPLKEAIQAQLIKT